MKLPKGWIEVELKEVCLPTQNEDPKESPSELFNYIDISALDNSRFEIVNPKVILGENAPSRARQKIKKGDTLFSTVRTNLKNIAYVSQKYDNNIASTGFAVIRPSSFLEDRFVFYYCTSNSFVDVVSSKQTGASYPAIRSSEFYKQTIPIAPLAEQSRIVEKLDTAFKKLRKVEETLEEVTKDSNNIVDSFLKKGKYERLEPHLVEKNERIGAKWKGLRLVGVDAKKGVTNLRVGTKKSFENYKIVKKGDFLYNPMRVNIGSIAYYEGEEDTLTSPDYVVFTVKEYLSPLLLFRYLKSPRGLAEIGRCTQGSVRQRLYFKNLINVKYPIIADKEQIKANKILDWYRNLRFLKREIDFGLKNLKDSLLSKAFKGELVAQNPKDEPASALLEKIKEEKKRLHEELNFERKKRKLVPKKRIVMKNLEIIEVLKIHGKPMKADDVWKECKYKEDIDTFYEKLRHEVEITKNVRSTVKIDQETYLSLIENGK